MSVNTEKIYNIELQELDVIDYIELKNLIYKLYILQGYNVNILSDDKYNIDLLIRDMKKIICIHIKLEKVDIEDIQKVYLGLQKHNCKYGIIITTSDFTNSAINLAKVYNIELINKEKLWKSILDIQNKFCNIKIIKNELTESKKQIDELINKLQNNIINIEYLKKEIETYYIQQQCKLNNTINNHIISNEKFRKEVLNEYKSNYKQLITLISNNMNSEENILNYMQKLEEYKEIFNYNKNNIIKIHRIYLIIYISIIILTIIFK